MQDDAACDDPIPAAAYPGNTFYLAELPFLMPLNGVRSHVRD